MRPENTPANADPSKLEMAYVLFMDIVSYSKLPMDRQKETLRSLQTIVSESPEYSKAQDRGQIIKLPTGDGMALVFFGDIEAAARCAVEISQAIKQREQIPLRMGLHHGAVYLVPDINEKQNVAGVGINIAQRIMDCGDAGHILTSQSVADVLVNLSTWSPYLHDLGETEVKHGLIVRLYNLYTNEVGNSELPVKVVTARGKSRKGQIRFTFRKITFGITFSVVSLCLIGAIWLQLRQHTAGSAAPNPVAASPAGAHADLSSYGLDKIQFRLVSALPDRPVTAKVTKRNTGGLDALHVKGFSILELYDGSKDRDAICQDLEQRLIGLRQAGQKLSEQTVPSGEEYVMNISGRTISNAEAEAIKNGTLGVYVAGTFVYSDANKANGNWRFRKRLNMMNSDNDCGGRPWKLW